MHEIGIAASVVDAVRSELSQRPGARAIAVGLRIGELSGVEPNSLTFGFESLVIGTDLASLRLEIYLRARMQHCLDCNARFRAERFTLECPQCGSVRSRCVSGDELEIAWIEIEENP